MPEVPVAAIDIGTNSIHLVVARPAGNNRFEILDREKEVVRLGSGSGDMKRLEPDAVARGVAALGRFRRIADSSGAEIHAVATSAVREAENRDEFLARARAEAGIRVEVISGVEEARLIHLGVLQAVPVFDRRVLVVDIGGGSTEFVVGLAGDVLGSRSLKLGAIRLTERFFAKGTVRKRAVDDCRRYVRAYLAPVARLVAHHGGFEVAVGSSGTIVNLAEMVHARTGREPLRQVSNARFTRPELDEVVADLVARPKPSERAEVAGLDPKRADIVVAGALLLEQIMGVLDIEEMTVSDHALREGVLLDVLRRRQSTSIGHLRDLRYESVAHLAALTPGEKGHSERVAELALELFEGTIPLHGLGEECEELLEAAGLLCNVGLAISHDRHHLHSYYVIRNSDLLTGFTDHEIEVIAQVARYHRKSPPRSRHTEFARLGDDDQRVVRILAGLLRVAVGLDRTRTGAVSGVRVTRAEPGKPVRVEVDTEADDLELELYSAEARKDLLEEALGVPVELVPAQDLLSDSGARAGRPSDRQGAGR